ncbi:hypothetical protein HZ326_7189 [Fusarium oxysporum f. sp. albedinis]|nr:hypothetical protein HZ326_7189 [Fusarium oxysporum f. sp. albedinis]
MKLSTQASLNLFRTYFFALSRAMNFERSCQALPHIAAASLLLAFHVGLHGSSPNVPNPLSLHPISCISHSFVRIYGRICQNQISKQEKKNSGLEET